MKASLPREERYRYERNQQNRLLAETDPRMPHASVKTRQHLIFYQYAKIIAKSVYGEENLKANFPFAMRKFHDLASGKISWSDILREDKQLVEADKVCVYCGAAENLSWEHIVPRSLQINERCSTCDKIQSIHNQVLACISCNSTKGAKGLYHFYRDKLPEGSRFYDLVPPLVEKKYLKTIFHCHECAGTLDTGKENGKLGALDLDFEMS